MCNSEITADDTNQPAAIFSIRSLEDSDVDQIAQMNKELIEDEGHTNPMNLAELKERLHHFVSRDGWTVDVFTSNLMIIGYATYRLEANISKINDTTIHIRQFYIARSQRGKGMGRRAYRLLIESQRQAPKRILIEVLESNPGGKAFWSRIGFTPYAMSMETCL